MCWAGAVAILVFSFLVVLAPLIWAKLVQYVPRLAPFDSIVTFARYGLAAAWMIVALLMVHLSLLVGRRSFALYRTGRDRDAAALARRRRRLWALSRLDAFAYVSMYAGLASAMIALVFLYLCATIFIFGGELNAAIKQVRGERTRV